jgi:hypothetical protein
MAKKLLRRREASTYLKEEHGVKCEPTTLTKLASIGGGPVYQKFGRDAVYTPENLDLWVEEKLSRPKRSATTYVSEDAAA